GFDRSPLVPFTPETLEPYESFRKKEGGRSPMTMLNAPHLAIDRGRRDRSFASARPGNASARALLVLAGTVFTTAFAALPASAASAASPTGDRWLHVRVQESGHGGETVRVNCPLSLIEAVLPTIRAEHLQNGRLVVHDQEIKSVDLKAFLKAVQNAGDA